MNYLSKQFQRIPSSFMVSPSNSIMIDSPNVELYINITQNYKDILPGTEKPAKTYFANYAQIS